MQWAFFFVVIPKDKWLISTASENTGTSRVLFGNDLDYKTSRRGHRNRGYLINPVSWFCDELSPEGKRQITKKDTGIAPPWDAYGAPSGRRICSGDATGRRISAAAGGGRLRCGHSLPASAQIRPAGEPLTSLLCL
ncbi:hypothetical protein HU200_037842 [Digitaria exilis]|uniref:Uncharacterized protein n=1 Tax=Digitaria exilis TaxID=1010633 RepID=A0A835BD16_9POAL|nr:hypothetical protein HU200_037842 [Digitaria exilis]